MIRLFSDSKGVRAEAGDWYHNGLHETWVGTSINYDLAYAMVWGNMNIVLDFVMEECRDMYHDAVTAILGGYARDTYFGKKPYDADIFIHLGPDWTEEEAFSRMEKLALWLRLMGFQVAISQAYGQADNPTDFDERHYCILQAEHEGLSVDIIATRATSVSHSLSMFDCNMNQCYMATACSPVEWEHGKAPCVLEFLKPLPPERIAKMKRRAVAVGLEV